MIYQLNKHERGNTINQVEFQLEINDEVVDITGASVVMEFKNASTGKRMTLSTQENGGLEITEPLNGVFVIKEQVIDWPDGNWNFTATYTFADGKIKTYINGVLPIVDKP